MIESAESNDGPSIMLPIQRIDLGNGLRLQNDCELIRRCNLISGMEDEINFGLGGRNTSFKRLNISFMDQRNVR